MKTFYDYTFYLVAYLIWGSELALSATMFRPQFEEFFPEMNKGKAMTDLVFRWVDQSWESGIRVSWSVFEPRIRILLSWKTCSTPESEPPLKSTLIFFSSIFIGQLLEEKKHIKDVQFSFIRRYKISMAPNFITSIKIWAFRLDPKYLDQSPTSDKISGINWSGLFQILITYNPDSDPNIIHTIVSLDFDRSLTFTISILIFLFWISLLSFIWSFIFFSVLDADKNGYLDFKEFQQVLIKERIHFYLRKLYIKF